MYLKLGLLGHARRIKLISNIINSYFKEIEIVTIEFNAVFQTKEIVQIIKNRKEHLDGILFTGKIPYDIINNEMVPTIPWDYLHNDHSQLLRTLLKASLVHKYDISKISIDSYEKEKIFKVFNEIGITDSELDIYPWEQNINDIEFVKNLELFHTKNYYNNKVSCCITGVSSIYENLLKKNIPCLSLDPTFDTVVQVINTFQLKQEALINKKSQLVILSIEIDLPNEYSLINENEYQMMLEKVKVSKQIYLFAQKIQSTVIEVGARGYLLFCTKSILESETKNIENFDLLSNVSMNTSSTISIGIGYGITAREAKYSANLGMKKAQRKGGNQAFVVYGGKEVIEPVHPPVNKSNQQQSYIDDIFHNIAFKTGLSINTIFKLHCIASENSTDNFTSNELAKHFKVTSRSMNRILDKLEKHGYMEIIGKKMISSAGRPSRIIRLLF
ncbi:hypothetical protein SH2C18_27420 [Clostridium sediminicola]|uniref:hypothetical protein n=1 Tax=Clostridium sediminicola TaxID=3114879 RepID=UPI0031F2356B